MLLGFQLIDFIKSPRIPSFWLLQMLHITEITRESMCPCVDHILPNYSLLLYLQAT